jgi:hypothetical protein
MPGVKDLDQPEEQKRRGCGAGTKEHRENMIMAEGEIQNAKWKI